MDHSEIPPPVPASTEEPITRRELLHEVSKIGFVISGLFLINQNDRSKQRLEKNLRTLEEQTAAYASEGAGNLRESPAFKEVKKDIEKHGTAEQRARWQKIQAALVTGDTL